MQVLSKRDTFLYSEVYKKEVIPQGTEQDNTCKSDLRLLRI